MKKRCGSCGESGKRMQLLRKGKQICDDCYFEEAADRLICDECSDKIICAKCKKVLCEKKPDTCTIQGHYKMIDEILCAMCG